MRLIALASALFLVAGGALAGPADGVFVCTRVDNVKYLATVYTSPSNTGVFAVAGVAPGLAVTGWAIGTVGRNSLPQFTFIDGYDDEGNLFKVNYQLDHSFFTGNIKGKFTACQRLL